MRWGERGDPVAVVQKALVDLGHSMPGSTNSTGGMDGIFGKETYAAVRHFQGSKTLGVDGIIGTETMTKLDELLAGSSPPGPGPTPTRAKFEATKPLDGFDHTAIPRWQMVPLRGFKIVRLIDGPSLTVVPADPATCTVHEMTGPFGHGGREFELRGVMAGKTQIEGRHGGSIICRLDVEVMTEKVVTVAFHYVSDNAGHSTTRTSAGLPALFNYARDILYDQIHVSLQQAALPANTQINEDLGDRVVWAEGDWAKVVAHRNASANLNVFFVWEYEKDADPGDRDAGGTIRSEGNTLMEDSINYPDHAWTLAHEIGHYLGFSGHSASGLDLLMSPARSNNRIDKAAAARMR